VTADLDTLLIALYVELTDRIIPVLGFARSGPGQPPEVTDAELVCMAVAQVLLRFGDERHWLRAAAKRIGHLFPRLLRQSEYNARLKNLAPLMEAALRWLAEATPGSAELLRLMDATPVPCGHSVITAKRSDLAGWAGYGYCPSHSRWYWGSKLLFICTCDGTVTGFGLANPKLFGEREAARKMLQDQPANRPAPGTAVVTDKGLSGEDTEAFFAGPGLGLTLIRPARKDEKTPRYFPNWLRQRVEAIIWTLNASVAHCAFFSLGVLERSSLGGFYLDTQAAAASTADVHGGEFAALDLVQNGLPGDAEGGGGLPQW
jgi:hypothetical protein